MKTKYLFLFTALFALISLSAGEMLSLTEKGVKIDSGILGNFIFTYPKFESDGKAVPPVVKLENRNASLTYLAEGAPVITLSLEKNTLRYSVKGKKKGKLSWTMHIPITFAGNGTFRFGGNGEFKLFPKNLPGKPHLAQVNSNSFQFIEKSSGCSLKMTSGRNGFWQLQDNRAWKWKLFQLTYIQDAGINASENFKLAFEFSQPKVANIKVDRFGQPKTMDFPGKIKNDADLKADLEADRNYYASLNPPLTAPWGGMNGSRAKFNLKATGFFRLEKIEGRDILVTPDGDIFFQLGVCTVGSCDDYTYIKGREQIYEWLPKYESEYKTAFRTSWASDFSFYLANRIRKAGRPHVLVDWKKEQVTRLRKWGFNSDGAFTAATPVNAQKKFGRTPGLYKPKGIVGDIYDPFDEAVRKDLDAKFSLLAKHAEDPTIIGYFIANEQPYSDLVRKIPEFTGKVAAKRELAVRLRMKYGTVAAFNKAWNLNLASLDALAALPLPVQTKEAWSDMESYGVHFFNTYFKLISETFRKYDPNHLLIGARFLPANVNVESATAACGRYCDLFSVNYYTRNIEPEFLERIHKIGGKPILLSEWSFGTAEQGLAGGVVDVRTQQERGYAYRAYVEKSAALPYVVGNQWFAYLDQALTGRFFQHYNGECMNIGLLNVADRPFKEFLAEVMKTNYRIYDVKLGKTAPFEWSASNAGSRNTRSLQIPRALSGHKVDGIKTPWPGRPSERIDSACLVDGASAGGVSADFWLCWDDKNLYLYAEVTDPTPALNKHRERNLWQSDCVELFTGSGNLDKSGPLLFGDRQILISANPSESNAWLMNHKKQPDMKIVVIPNSKGYSVEAAIPWSALNIKPHAGVKFRFDLGLDNGDNGPRRLQQFMWSGKANNSADRSKWGTATLVE